MLNIFSSITNILTALLSKSSHYLLNKVRNINDEKTKLIFLI